ncbi:MAG: transcription antitermination factor NusB [Pseudomonadota bacterium]
MSDAPDSSVQPKSANKRGAARLAAVQALYQMDVGGTGVVATVEEFERLRLGQELDGSTYLAADASWFRGLVSGVVADQTKIDPMIHGALTSDWPLSRIDSILRAVLRSAVFELRERKDVPARVIISEYVDVAKAFFEEDEPKMVNGVLDRISRRLRSGELSDAKTGDRDGV